MFKNPVADRRCRVYETQLCKRCGDAQQLAVGDTLALGDAKLKIAAVLVIEPDRGQGFARPAGGAKRRQG